MHSSQTPSDFFKLYALFLSRNLIIKLLQRWLTTMVVQEPIASSRSSLRNSGHGTEIGNCIIGSPESIVPKSEAIVTDPNGSSHYRPNMRRTLSLTLASYSGRRSRHILAASTLAGLSSLGSASMLMTEIRIFSTDWMGLQRSEACS